MAYFDQVRPRQVWGKLRYAATKIFPYTVPTNSALTGTAVAGGVTEAQMVTGGETLIITLTNGKFIPSGTKFNAQRQAIINGLDSAQAEAAGFDAQVRANMAVTTVVRTSDTVVTITFGATAGYSVAANETITVTVPAAAMEGAFVPLVAGTFVITAA